MLKYLHRFYDPLPIKYYTLCLFNIFSHAAAIADKLAVVELRGGLPSYPLAASSYPLLMTSAKVEHLINKRRLRIFGTQALS